jgi:proline iminopeptidase
MPPVPPPRAAGLTATTEVPLHWALYGPAGAPRLLVLHGGPGADHQYLLPQMLRLAEGADGHELLFYDQRGGGRSKPDNLATVTWRTQVDDLARVVAELGPDPLHVVGYSWGALLALLHALDAAGVAMPCVGAPLGDVHPHARVAPASLTLIDPAPLSRAHRVAFETEFARRQAGPAIQAMRAELAGSGLRERDPDAYRQRAFELSVAGYFFDPAAARDLTPFRVTGRVQQSVWESLGDFDLVPLLGAVACPTLIVHGREDPIPLASSEAAAAALPDARLVVLDRCGHVPYVEQPDALFAAVLPFLAERATAGRGARSTAPRRGCSASSAGRTRA